MDETHVNWWMDDTSRWHRGSPPAGWWQAEDGRWHPPRDDDEPTEEVREVPHAGAAHFGGESGRPRWTRIAVLASVVLVAIVLVTAAAIMDDGGDGETVTADVSTTVAPSTTAPAATIPGSASSEARSTDEDTDPPAPPTTGGAATTERVPTTTTTAPAPQPAPAPTSPPPSNPDVHQGAACSPEGATAVSSDGVPMTCTTQKCHGAPFDSARWRRTAC